MKIIGFYLLFFTFSSSVLSQKYLPKSYGEVIYHKYYTLSYNESHEQANWVHYKINPIFLRFSFLFSIDDLKSLNPAKSSQNKEFSEGEIKPEENPYFELYFLFI